MTTLALFWLFLRTPSDAATLANVERWYGLPAGLLVAVAVAESGYDSTRGQAARGPGRGSRHTCREIGRLQVSPCLSWPPAMCRPAYLAHYHTNVRCGAWILRDLYRRHGSWAVAVERYNGSGPAARLYRQRVLAWWAEWRLDRRRPVPRSMTL